MLTTSAPATELAGILDEEAGLYRQLIELGERERAVVFGVDAAELADVTSEKERIIAQVARAESHRTRWIAAWAAGEGLDEAAVTVSTVIARSNAADASALAPKRDELMAVLRDLAELNYRNGQLVNSALGVVSRQLDAYGRVTGGPIYRPTGERTRQGGGATAVLDFRA